MYNKVITGCIDGDGNLGEGIRAIVATQVPCRTCTTRLTIIFKRPVEAFLDIGWGY